VHHCRNTLPRRRRVDTSAASLGVAILSAVGRSVLGAGARRRASSSLLGLPLCVLSLVALAHRHAKTLTVFAESGGVLPEPEALGPGTRLRAAFGGAWVPKPKNRLHPADEGLRCTTVTLRTDDGLRLESWHLERPGARGMAVMLPGYRLTKSSLLWEARALLGMGYECLLVDFRGQGGSEGLETSLGYREAQDVAAAYAWARHRGRPVLLYASSMGVAAALRAVALGLAAPDGLLLESPFDRLLTTLKRRLRLLGLPAWPAAELILFWGGRRLGFDAFRHNPRDYAASVSTPTTVLHAEGDQRTSVDEARGVVDALRGPHSFVTFPGTRHGGLRRADPERWTRSIGELLDALEWPIAVGS
jgi:alpha-beta hydrolase superfamily lysophospholipase